jgi:hypothetical protein
MIQYLQDEKQGTLFVLVTDAIYLNAVGNYIGIDGLLVG